MKYRLYEDALIKQKIGSKTQVSSLILTATQWVNMVVFMEMKCSLLQPSVNQRLKNAAAVSASGRVCLPFNATLIDTFAETL